MIMFKKLPHPTCNRMKKIDKQNVRKAYTQLNQFDFSNVDRKFSLKHPDIKPKDARIECLRFMALGMVREVSPPPILDDYWHEYILHTKKYTRETNLVFGEYFHHAPNDGTNKARGQNNDQMWETIDDYEKIFGPVNMKVWELEKRKAK